ncbi:MAG: glycogen synthase, partial [Deltaproteobacteria bacterium]|nr:glycogen synthase [Deltaproteobacteria bacterium]
MKILFLSPEAVPFAKTGGLADVAGSLPLALKRLGADVRLVLPYYRLLREENVESRPLIEDLPVPLGKARLTCSIGEARTKEGIPVYLVAREDLYDRPHLYGTAAGDYYDNLERFTFFARAALRTAAELDFRPGLIHCHDWQTGLAPALLRGPDGKSSILRGTPVLFTIHNIGYQGIFPGERFSVTGLSREDFFRMEGLEFWGNISLLKAGIVYADALTTVSPTYAKEILTPEYGMGMEGILATRRGALHGILNGVDYSLWNPAGDARIPRNYTSEDLAGKRSCKEALIREMGLDPRLDERPLLAMITRLNTQKGLDLILEVLDDILDLDTGLVFLGAGDEGIQDALREAAVARPGRVGLRVGFDEGLAHRIMAGADILLI